ncbi:MAG TPA: hypothetical protein VK566_04270 [Nitrososphaeraceae archaeon]|nr:hypothetical protein [Nitrososphaeraceae archaeon]
MSYDDLAPSKNSIVVISLIFIGAFMINPIYQSADLELYLEQIHGQEDSGFITSSLNANTSLSNSSANHSELGPPVDNEQFTITCSNFKQLYDALSELNIGNMAAEGNINQSTLDGVETIFNNHAGNCSQLDEYEFE